MSRFSLQDLLLTTTVLTKLKSSIEIRYKGTVTRLVDEILGTVKKDIEIYVVIYVAMRNKNWIFENYSTTM